MAATADSQQNNSSKDEEEKHFCRICHGTDEDEDSKLGGIDQEWVQPCKCSGTIKWVHRGCFKAWHDQAPYEQCTQCSMCSYVFRFSSPRFKSRWYAEWDIWIEFVCLWALLLFSMLFCDFGLIFGTGIFCHMALRIIGYEQYDLFEGSIQNAL